MEQRTAPGAQRATSRMLTLDQAMLCDMLGDREFYAACPVFLFLRTSALQAYAVYREQLQRGDCSKCATQIMGNVLAVFVQHIRDQFDLCPANLECVKQYLERKRRRRPDRCKIYVRENDRPVAIEF